MRPRELAQLFSDPLGCELTKGNPASETFLTCGLSGLRLTCFLRVPGATQANQDLIQKVLLVCR